MRSPSKYIHLIQTAILLIFIPFSFSVQAAEPSCADFLELNNYKSKHLTFRSCERTNDAQLRVLVATYTVEGIYAEKLEQDLINKFNMPQLRFVCCGWETSMGYGSFVYQGYNVSIRMSSSETILRDRKEWSKIPKFIVRATLFLEEP